MIFNRSQVGIAARTPVPFAMVLLYIFVCVLLPAIAAHSQQASAESSIFQGEADTASDSDYEGKTVHPQPFRPPHRLAVTRPDRLPDADNSHIAAGLELIRAPPLLS